MQTVRSADGTPLAFDRAGDGPALILVVGALQDRSATAALAARLAPQFTVYRYDRRGRGDSGDTGPYSVDREIADLGALIAEAGGSAFVFGHSSGAVLALEAAARGVAITRLAVYEPPYVVDPGLSRRRVALAGEVDGLLAAGRPGDAVQRFLIEAVELRPDMVAMIRASRLWPLMLALAPTLRYDLAILDGGLIPAARLARVGVPTLFLDGAASPGWARASVRAAASTVPGARHRSLDGQDHNVAAGVLAPLLAEYFGCAASRETTA
jgi:pimeloyl-ACP methyl ester carboxylesterase